MTLRDTLERTPKVISNQNLFSRLITDLVVILYLVLNLNYSELSPVKCLWKISLGNYQYFSSDCVNSVKIKYYCSYYKLRWKFHLFIQRFFSFGVILRLRVSFLGNQLLKMPNLLGCKYLYHCIRKLVVLGCIVT